MEEGHGVAELLIPSVPAVRVATRHHFTTQLIGATALQSMPQQGRSDFEGHPEILEPSGEGMPEVMEVEIGHFRFAAQSSPERAEGRRIPSPEDSPIHMDQIASEGLVGCRSEGNL